MEWLVDMLGAVAAQIVAGLVLLLLGGTLGAVLGPLVFGRNYKQRIVNLEQKISALEQRLIALEARVSQPIVINNVISGNERARNWTGDVTEIRTLTQAEYDALATKSETTLYLIRAQR